MPASIPSTTVVVARVNALGRVGLDGATTARVPGLVKPTSVRQIVTQRLQERKSRMRDESTKVGGICDGKARKAPFEE